ncbi:MAG TPA: AraC family transcriptional regulator [Ktedonobacterales bacterium]
MGERRASGERAIYTHAPDFGALELLHARFVTHSFVPHTHDGFAIGVIEAGAERFRYRRGTHVAPAGALVLINPGEPHTGAAAAPDGWQYRMLYPEAELLRGIASELAGQARQVPFFPEPVVWDPAMARTLGELHHLLEVSHDPLERDTRLRLALAALMQRHADAPHRTPPTRAEAATVRQTREYLAAHATEPVALAALATLAGMSAFHLVRVFTAGTGLPPHAYLTQLRVAHAKRLLARRLPAGEVAQLVGFYDQSHLTRHFKRIVGVPPAQYARHL